MSPSLDDPVAIPFMIVDDATPEILIEAVRNVIESRKRFELNGCTINFVR